MFGIFPFCSSGGLEDGWTSSLTTNCQPSMDVLFSFTPKTLMSSGLLCWRKPTPSTGKSIKWKSLMYCVYVSVFVVLLTCFANHFCQGVWFLLWHDCRHSCRSHDGLHRRCPHVHPAVRPPFQSVETHVQSRTNQISNELWYAPGGECKYGEKMFQGWLEVFAPC